MKLEQPCDKLWEKWDHHYHASLMAPSAASLPTHLCTELLTTLCACLMFCFKTTYLTNDSFFPHPSVGWARFKVWYLRKAIQTCDFHCWTFFANIAQPYLQKDMSLLGLPWILETRDYSLISSSEGKKIPAIPSHIKAKENQEWGSVIACGLI